MSNLNTPVAARTRSRRSVDAPRPVQAFTNRSRIPTATTRTSARLRPSLVRQSEGEGEGQYVGIKRKSEGGEGRDKKRHSSGQDLQAFSVPLASHPENGPAVDTVHAQPEAGPSTPRRDMPPQPTTPSHDLARCPSRLGRSPHVLTPGRSLHDSASGRSPHSTTPGRSPRTPGDRPRPPTPARILLRADPDDERKMACVQPRPPTPPRVAARTAANGYPFITPKRPRSPQPDGRLTVPRLMGSEAANARPVFKTSLSAFFTPQPSRQLGFTAGGVPATAGPARAIAPLPRARAAPPSANSRLPVRAPPTPRVTVPVPFGGRVGESTHASLMKSAVKRTEAAPPLASAPVASITEEAMSVEEGDNVGSQAPGPVLPPPAPASSAVTTASSVVVPEVSQPILSMPMTSLRPRRPTSRPITHPSTSENSMAPPTGRRQPSYPSSLGSGPPSRPTNRVVSNPFPAPSAPRNSESRMDVDDADDDADGPSTRSLRMTSEPTRCASPPPSSKRDSLSMPSRREGYDDTARNLSKLNAALANLRLPTSARATDSVRPTPRPRPPTPSISATPNATLSIASTPRPRNLSSRQPLASVGVNIARTKTLPADVAKANKGRSIESLLTAEQSTLFKGVVAYVDVRNEDGSEVGSSFVEMLRNAGARVSVHRRRRSRTGTHAPDRVVHAHSVQERQAVDWGVLAAPRGRSASPRCGPALGRQLAQEWQAGERG